MRQLERYLSAAFGGGGSSPFHAAVCCLRYCIEVFRLSQDSAPMSFRGGSALRGCFEICTWKEELLYVILIQHHPLERLDA